MRNRLQPNYGGSVKMRPIPGVIPLAAFRLEELEIISRRGHALERPIGKNHRPRRARKTLLGRWPLRSGQSYIPRPSTLTTIQEILERKEPEMVFRAFTTRWLR